MTAFQRNENRALGVTHIMVIFMKYLDRIPTRNPSTTQFCVRFENKKNQKKPFGQRKSRNVLAKFKWSIGAVTVAVVYTFQPKNFFIFVAWPTPPQQETMLTSRLLHEYSFELPAVVLVDLEFFEEMSERERERERRIDF